MLFPVVRTADESAQTIALPKDYTTIDELLVFEACESEANFTIAIYNDEYLEGAGELFRIDLFVVTEGYIEDLAHTFTYVKILDDDSKRAVSLRFTFYFPLNEIRIQCESK